MYWEDPKQAILEHPEWHPNDQQSPPIFDLYLSDFNASGKKEKCSLSLPNVLNKMKFPPFLKTYTTEQKRLTQMAP
jgi:hypothetical protein